MLASRPELIAMDRAENDEHRALHYAVLRRDVPMVRLLMEAGADARKGIFPHRDATSSLALAMDREYHEVVAVIDTPELDRATIDDIRRSARFAASRLTPEEGAAAGPTVSSTGPSR